MENVFYALAGLVVLGFGLAVVNGFLAPLKLHLHVDLDSLPKTPAGSADPFVGLALSGGGARAAVFAAAGMKALHDRGLLATVTHVSSVSGGGFPASYLALRPLPDSLHAGDYFDRMLDVVAHDHFWDTQVNQLRNPMRAFSPSRRLISLQEAMDHPDFLRHATFGDLPSDRTFFFNTVSYDTGQRVVLSNGALPGPEMRDTNSALPVRLRSLSFSDEDTLRAAPTYLPVSLAVATSAAFPPYLGPMTIKVASASKADRYMHLGDGGVLENSGVETLLEAIYARGPDQSATIYSFNAGVQLDSDLSQNTADISIWSRDVTRLVDVVLEYATAHRDTTFSLLDDKNSMKINHVEFNYMEIVRHAKSDPSFDPRWSSWDGWSCATAADRAASATPAEHLAKIPTALKITPCDRELIAAAAEALVEAHFPSDQYTT